MGVGSACARSISWSTVRPRRWRRSTERSRRGGLGSSGIGPGSVARSEPISWIVLVIALVTGIGELIALTGVEPPVAIRQPFNTIIGFAALLAALERALRFKTNRWLD